VRGGHKRQGGDAQGAKDFGYGSAERRDERCDPFRTLIPRYRLCRTARRMFLSPRRGQAAIRRRVSSLPGHERRSCAAEQIGGDRKSARKFAIQARRRSLKKPWRSSCLLALTGLGAGLWGWFEEMSYPVGGLLSAAEARTPPGSRGGFFSGAAAVGVGDDYRV